VGMDGRVARTVAAAEEDTTRRRSSRMVSTRVRRPSQKRSSEEGLQSSRDAADDSIGGEAEQRLVLFCFGSWEWVGEPRGGRGK
jgi:hypothetical protein